MNWLWLIIDWPRFKSNQWWTDHEMTMSHELIVNWPKIGWLAMTMNWLWTDYYNWPWTDNDWPWPDHNWPFPSMAELELVMMIAVVTTVNKCYFGQAYPVKAHRSWWWIQDGFRPQFWPFTYSWPKRNSDALSPVDPQCRGHWFVDNVLVFRKPIYCIR